MDAVYPGRASALARGRRLRSGGPRLRHHTTPVTFAEIKEVDEESVETEACEGRGAGPRRRPDVLEERFGKQFEEFRRRRATKREVLREREPESPPRAPAAAMARAGSEPGALNQPSAHT